MGHKENDAWTSSVKIHIAEEVCFLVYCLKNLYFVNNLFIKCLVIGFMLNLGHFREGLI